LVETVSLHSTLRWLDATGTVRPELESLIAAKVTGRVEAVAVREGDAVYRGQLLVRLDDRDLAAAVAQADAGLRSAQIGLKNAQITYQMERATSAARITEAQAGVAQSEAALKAAQAKLQLVLAGPRQQEREQAAQAVASAKSQSEVAQATLSRLRHLYTLEAITRQQLDEAQVRADVASAQYQQALQAQSIATEGSRAEEIVAAREGVHQADAAVVASRAALRTAQSGSLQTDVRREAVQGAKAEIDNAAAAVNLARVIQGFATLSAPFDGIVASRLVDPGALVNPGVPLLKIQGSALRLEAIVPESGLSAIHSGESVPVRFDSKKGKSAALTGRVVEIAPQGDTDSHTFVVKIDLPVHDDVAVGMFGRAQFPIGSEQELTIPRAAVTEREGLHYVYVVDAGHQARLRLVTPGATTDGERVTILTGLNPGETVVTQPSEGLRDGVVVSMRR